MEGCISYNRGRYCRLFGVIIFNPFHLTNLTHTFVISVSKHAERWRDVHEWHPAFAWDNPVGTAVPFLVMYIIAWVVLAVWVVVLILTSRSVSSIRRSERQPPLMSINGLKSIYR